MKSEFNFSWMLPAATLAAAPSDSAGNEPQACLLPEPDPDATTPWFPSEEEAPWLSDSARSNLLERHQLRLAELPRSTDFEGDCHAA
jgi:hypothetical protein